MKITIVEKRQPQSFWEFYEATALQKPKEAIEYYLEFEKHIDPKDIIIEIDKEDSYTGYCYCYGRQKDSEKIKWYDAGTIVRAYETELVK